MAAERILIDGPAGGIEVFIDSPVPAGTPQGIVIVGHPHPLFGGSADNKVAVTLARVFREMRCVALRPNFRGVGATAGKHDHGIAETEDMYAVYQFARSRFGQLPLYLAGFSFGAFVITRLAKRLAEEGAAARRLVLVGTAAGYVEGARSYAACAVPPDTVVIHGAKDETVRLENVLQWAEPLELPVIVVPGADHFFHRRLHILRGIIARSFRPPAPPDET